MIKGNNITYAMCLWDTIFMGRMPQDKNKRRL